MEHKERLLCLVPADNKVQELIPHKDYEIKQDGEKFYLVKKKKEYPTTYEECHNMLDDTNKISVFDICKFAQLLEVRNVYWKIAGEEMGLDGPWKPDWENKEEDKYTIEYFDGMVYKDRSISCSRPFVFPTKEMRDTFYANFKEEIEQCKELL